MGKFIDSGEDVFFIFFSTVEPGIDVAPEINAENVEKKLENGFIAHKTEGP